MTTSRPMEDPVLLADIGGTNARFAIADPAPVTKGERIDPLQDGSLRVYSSLDFVDLAEATAHYLRDIGAMPRRALVAVAGPVIGDRTQLTNCPWRICAQQTRDRLGLDSLRLVNDFHAMARSVPVLRSDEVEPLGPMPRPRFPEMRERRFAVVGPGTGLGVAYLDAAGAHVRAIETEAGHIGFAPVDAFETEVLRVLRARHGRVSVERILSGPGLVALHLALAEIDGRDAETTEPAALTRAAGADEPAALRTVEVFCAILGSVCGDLVLALRAFDGLYLPGGLVVPMLRWLRQPAFRDRFADKGRFSAELAATPALAVVHPQPGMLGLAAIAADLPTR